MNSSGRTVSKGITYLLLSISISMIVPACSYQQAQKPNPPARIYTRLIKSQDIYDVYTYPAQVQSKINATILAETSGVVTHVNKTLGSKTHAGEKILTVTHTDPGYQYAPVRVVAPIMGMMSSIDVAEGSYVVLGQKLASMVDPEQLEVQLEVPAHDLPSVKKGTIGEFTSTTIPSSVPVQVAGVSPLVDQSTGTASARLFFQKELMEGLTPGLHGQVRFRINTRRGILIPFSSVLYKKNNPYVGVVANKKVTQVPVKIGKKQFGNVEVLDGLSDEICIMERSSRSVLDGELVVIENSQI